MFVSYNMMKSITSYDMELKIVFSDDKTYTVFPLKLHLYNRIFS